MTTQSCLSVISHFSMVVGSGMPSHTSRRILRYCCEENVNDHKITLAVHAVSLGFEARRDEKKVLWLFFTWPTQSREETE